MDLYLSALLTVICAILVWSWLASGKDTHSAHLPPSLPSDPLIGHMRILMSAPDASKEYSRWSKELGSDIISFNVLGHTTIVLNSRKIAEDLLSKRSSIYSDRPGAGNTMVLSDRLVGWGNNTVMQPYGERWRVQRQMTQEFFHKRMNENLWPIITKNSRLALQRLLDDPERFESHFRRMTGSSIIKAVYGYESTESNDPLLETVSSALQGFSQALLASNFYVNFIPWMQYIPAWFPGAQWKREALKWRWQTEQMLNVPYDWTREEMASGTAPPSMLSQLLARYTEEPSEEERDIVRWATGALFAAGTDTTLAISLVIVLAMAMHPELQAKAQAEVDSVLHDKRLPDMDDRPSMPYVHAIVKEVLRWRSVAPLGVPHACTEEDIYEGYRIPKGTTIIANQRAISNDERVYPNPERFDPSRFLDPSTPEAPLFGFGRRSCPGINFAQDMLFMLVSGLLACFDIRPKLDSEGNHVPLTAEMEQNTFTSLPLSFKVDIEPRSEKHKRLLREWADI